MLQMLWIGCLESDEEFEIKAKKGYDLASAQVSQKNFLSGIEEVSNMTFDSINGSVLPPYPVYKDRIIKPIEWKHKPEAVDISVGYKNYKYINRINCKKAMIKAADKWCDTRYKGDEVIVFVYSMRSAPMATACHIKEKISRARIYLIITDLPQFMDLGQSKIKAVLKKIDWKTIKNMQQKFDGFILYAEKMAEYLDIPDDKWILMEGSYDSSEQVIVAEKKKAIMYSGKLDERYGIKMLLDAFMHIPDKNVELWLTGGGNAEQYIKECMKKDIRIKFYGFLPSRQDVLKKQAEASLLINMRLPSEEASGYCFPSKLLEYMAIGTPVLSFDIAGIPREYLPYLFVVKEEKVDILRKKIQMAMQLDKKVLTDMGKKAADFIRSRKTKVLQSRRVWEYVSTKKTNKLFTIVVCTYNGEKFLNKCLTAIENLLKLREFTDRVYVVDNNSSDNTADIIKQYCNKNDLFEYVFEKRQGLSYAREQATKASTDWVIYVDDDNILGENWLVELKKTIEVHKDVGIINGAVIATPEGDLSREQKAILKVMYRNLACTHCEEPKSGDIPNTVPMGAGMCIRTEALKNIKKYGWLKLKGREGEKLSSGEDTELCERVIKQGYGYISNYKMKLYHIIPQIRLEEQYVIRLIEGLVKGRVEFIKLQKFSRLKCFLRKIKYCIDIQIEINTLKRKDLSIEDIWKHKVALYQAEAFIRNL